MSTPAEFPAAGEEKIQHPAAALWDTVLTSHTWLRRATLRFRNRQILK
jgi:hypothetical protein